MRPGEPTVALRRGLEGSDRGLAGGVCQDASSFGESDPGAEARKAARVSGCPLGGRFGSLEPSGAGGKRWGGCRGFGVARGAARWRGQRPAAVRRREPRGGRAGRGRVVRRRPRRQGVGPAPAGGRVQRATLLEPGGQPGRESGPKVARKSPRPPSPTHGKTFALSPFPHPIQGPTKPFLSQPVLSFSPCRRVLLVPSKNIRQGLQIPQKMPPKRPQQGGCVSTRRLPCVNAVSYSPARRSALARSRLIRVFCSVVRSSRGRASRERRVAWSSGGRAALARAA